MAADTLLMAPSEINKKKAVINTQQMGTQRSVSLLLLLLLLLFFKFYYFNALLSIAWPEVPPTLFSASLSLSQWGVAFIIK